MKSAPTLFIAVALAVVAATVAEIVFPGRDVYHSGWFNVSLIALAVVTALASRGQFVRARSNRARIGAIAIAFGTAVAGVAGAASGLLAPDNATVVGAPGQRVRVGDLGGTLDFPLAGTAGMNSVTSDGAAVVLNRPGHRPLRIGERGSNAGSFILRSRPRQVVYVEARDSQGGRLTVTQPSGASFLSPVLLMQQSQTIAGLALPFDSFAVPAAHRIVKAVLFTAQEAATLRGMEGTAAAPAVLFAVDDENDRPLPHAIAAARDGATVGAGGLLLHATVLAYPAVEVIAVPALAAVVAGALLVLAGLIAKGVDDHDATARS
ncbi:MAG: hypothetical protein ABI231_07760 [Candidatus Tumulicola sp.]